MINSNLPEYIEVQVEAWLIYVRLTKCVPTKLWEVTEYGQNMLAGPM